MLQVGQVHRRISVFLDSNCQSHSRFSRMSPLSTLRFGLSLHVRKTRDNLPLSPMVGRSDAHFQEFQTKKKTTGLRIVY